jgi:mono/diheme cytochrome c family protein
MKLLIKSRILSTITGLMIIVLASCSDKGVEPTVEPGPTFISYADDIQPIFNANCSGCHAGGNQGGLTLDNYASLIQGGNSGAVIVAGDPDGSLLIQRLEGTVTPQMPLGQTPLPSSQIQTIRDWIENGAEDN